MVLDLEPRDVVRAGRGHPCHRDMTSRHGRHAWSGGIVSDMFFDADNALVLAWAGTRRDSADSVGSALPTQGEEAGS